MRIQRLSVACVLGIIVSLGFGAPAETSVTEGAVQGPANGTEGVERKSPAGSKKRSTRDVTVDEATDAAQAWLDRESQEQLHGKKATQPSPVSNSTIPEGTWFALADDIQKNSRQDHEMPTDLGDAEGHSGGELAKQTQNPVADLISVPFQNNALFGSDGNVTYNLNIQPVIPMNINEDWNWIHRMIIPINYVPSSGSGISSAGGMGDIQYQGYLTPAKADKLVLGFGPVLQFPSATDDLLGTEKWAMGPGGLILYMDGPWVVGCLINNIWSVAGNDDRKDVNLMTIQPIINYNLDDGWYLCAVPIITADWEADSSDRWTVPVGGGIGKIVKIGKLPVNIRFQGFYNILTPTNGPDWTLQLQIQFLFPKKKG